MRRSVLIGINQYESAPRLAGCVRDATDMASILGEEEYGFEVATLLDADASRRKCLDVLWEAAENTGEFLLIYFAGHGGVHGEVGYLMTSDGVARDPGVGLLELAQIVAAAAKNYEHVVTILDACHAGAGATWTDHRPLTATSVSHSMEIVNSSRILMAACRPDQYAYEIDEPEAHGAFTKVLLDALMGDAVDFRGNVTALSLFDLVAARMDDERQTPVFKGDSAGSVVLGSGFTPRIGSPVEPQQKATLLARAERLLDEYQILQVRELSQSEHRRESGLSNCAVRLAEIIRWFESSEHEDRDIARAPEWKRFRDAIVNYQGSLAALAPGDRLPVGTVGRHVGGGGFGNVWEIVGEQPFAYKVFHGAELREEVKVKRFRNGFHSMERLDHPRIVSVIRLTEAPLGFSMDLVDGPDLRDAHIDRADAEVVLTMAIDIADTVRFAHGAGVVHRDIKPENVILGWDAQSQTHVPQLTDFDLAYIETNRTVTINMVGGVVNYAAPEQFYASNSARARAITVDVFAFAQLMYFIVIGADPMADRRDANVAKFSEAVGHLLPYGPADQLIDLYQRSSEREPDDRPQSMDDVFEILTRAKIEHDSVTKQVEFTQPQVCEQVAHTYVGPGRYSREADGVVLESRAATLNVSLQPRGVPANAASDFVFTLSAQKGFGVPGAGSGGEARAILNRRLDKRLQRFPRVSRRPGSQGFFQTHIRIESVPLTLAGASLLVEILGATIAAIEQLD